VLVAHPTEASVRILPAFRLEGRIWAGEPAEIVAAVRARFDLAVTMLYSVRERYHMAARTLDLAVVVEATDSTVMAGDAADEDRDLVATAVAQLDAGSTAWSARGWIAGAGAWLRAAATAAGREPAGPVEQVRAWAVSTVLRVPTTGGYVYFKSSAAMPLFADEAAVTAALAGMFPGAVPAPLAVDPGRGWIATAGFGDPIGPDAPVPARVDLVRDFARLQIAAAGRVGELSGCVDRRLGRLAGDHAGWLKGPHPRRHLTDAEYDQLQACAAALPARCAELAAHGVPDSLIHGDLHPGNAARTTSGHLFFDWTDAAIGHPFLDMFLILEEADEAAAAELRAAYLGEWSAYTGTNLDAAWDAARVLVAAHHAVSYTSLTSAIDPPDAGLDRAAAGFLRLFIAISAERQTVRPGGGVDT
jgi:hypothetical protein